MRELEQWGRLRGPCCAAWPGKERRKDPNEDTEWNDILRHFGILPPKEKPKDETAEIVLHSQKVAEVKPYERMNLEELKEAEDDFDEADRKAIEMYRQQCLQEWKCLQRMQKYGELREISGEQYVEEVTIAPEDVWVIIHLYRTSIPMCLLVNGHLSLLVRKFPGVKFLKAIVNSCIQNYNDRCLPTILLYKTGEIKGRFIGIAECGGIYLKVEGAVTGESRARLLVLPLEEALCRRRARGSAQGAAFAGRGRAGNGRAGPEDCAKEGFCSDDFTFGLLMLSAHSTSHNAFLGSLTNAE
ncbi:phosducin-like protein 2 [Patagioenas fasciata monilis]|uniref:Phosducin-like protein 2 n=1 Tax=Patagioenas fasciata monilis TaxID=372326 RepID=A0A1V4JG28_PATFA|nr:phosducin-like protein 2 [Patagioenas fasciata monilis]